MRGIELRFGRLPPERVGGIVAWTAAVPCAIWMLLRLLGIDLGYPFVALIAYTPYVIPVAAVAAVAGALLRRWIPAGIAAVAAGILIALVAPRALGGGEAHSGIPVRVMSANLSGGRADPERLMELVRERRLDVVAVQELTPGLAARLEQLGIRAQLPFAVLFPRDGAIGSGIYSRYPARSMGAGENAALQARAMLVARRGLSLDVTSVHPVPPTGPDPTESWSDTLDALPRPEEGGALHLLLGDFNATLDHSELREILDRGYADAGEKTGGGLVPTWPTFTSLRYLPVTIDHLLFERGPAGTRDYEVLGLEGSDHRAVYAELSIRG